MILAARSGHQVLVSRTSRSPSLLVRHTAHRATAELSPAHPPDQAAKFALAKMAAVFEKVRASFSKKSFGYSTVAEYNLVVG